jgi:biotin carboxylase
MSSNPSTPPSSEPLAARIDQPGARVLVIAPNGSYRTAPFVAAAQRVNAEAFIVSHGQYALTGASAPGLHVDFDQLDAALAAILREHQQRPFRAVLGTDDATTELAARVAQAMGLPHNDPAAARISRRKDLARERLRAAGVPAPNSRRIDMTRPLAPQAAAVSYPCVVKPLALSASRGVIRADNEIEFMRACHRSAALVREAESEDERTTLLAEDFIPGVEVAVEGLLSHGTLQLLAIFDKPDPLDGPFFEETYYITPSRLTPDVQQNIQECVQAACAAYGLREGPVHAECRVNIHGAWILEVASRTIGGLCGRLLRFGTGYSLEEIVIAHALGQTIDTRASEGAGGVLMIPATQAGILRRVEGVLAAQNVEFVDEVTIQMREGYEVVPWPEGSSYLGFIFAHAPTPQQAEAALRAAHACLNIVTAPVWHGVDKRTWRPADESCAD